MSDTSFVSVIIPFFNAEKYLNETIDSVLAQTYDAWELLLVDDGSTDGSSAIARSYAERAPAKVRYIEHDGHKNRGVCASRNVGIREARGEYIALLDADDLWFPHKLARQVDIMETQPEAGMVFGPSEYWYSWLDQAEVNEQDYVQDHAVAPNTLFQPPALTTLSYPLGSAPTPCPSNLMFRRELALRIGGFEEAFTGKYQLYEDQAFLAKVYLNAPVFVSDECWDRYRQHPESCVAVVNNAGQYHMVRHYFLNWLEAYLAKQGIADGAVLRGLRHALWPYRHPTLNRLDEGRKHAVKWSKRRAKKIAKQTLPVSVRRKLRAIQGRSAPQHTGEIQFGDLRRLTPISQQFGYDRGRPIDRYYIEGFLERHKADIQGRVLEIGDNTYTQAFGGPSVTTSDVLHIVEGNPHATIVGDLTCAAHIPSDTFDCIILTQTLDLIYDVRAALRTVYRILKPGGVVLATVPGISPIGHDEWTESLCWNFTAVSTRRLFGETFPPSNVQVEAFGNVLVATAFLYGLAVEDLHEEELDFRDRGYDLLMTVRATKPKVAA